MCVYVFVCFCVFVYVCMCVYVYVCMFISIHLYLRVYVCMCAYLGMCVFVFGQREREWCSDSDGYVKAEYSGRKEVELKEGGISRVGVGRGFRFVFRC